MMTQKQYFEFVDGILIGLHEKHHEPKGADFLLEAIANTQQFLLMLDPMKSIASQEPFADAEPLP